MFIHLRHQEPIMTCVENWAAYRPEHRKLVVVQLISKKEKEVRLKNGRTTTYLAKRQANILMRDIRIFHGGTSFW